MPFEQWWTWWIGKLVSGVHPHACWMYTGTSGARFAGQWEPGGVVRRSCPAAHAFRAFGCYTVPTWREAELSDVEGVKELRKFGLQPWHSDFG